LDLENRSERLFQKASHLKSEILEQRKTNRSKNKEKKRKEKKRKVNHVDTIKDVKVKQENEYGDHPDRIEKRSIV